MKKIIKYFSYDEMNRQIQGYGFSYSFKSYLKSLMVMEIITILMSVLYRLQLPYVILICVVSLCCVPAIIKAQFSFMDKQQRFTEVEIYLKQMITSFLRIPKIDMALEDSEKVSSGKMKELIGKARNELRYNRSNRIYEDALSYIEEEYKTSKLSTLHKFLIGVEKRGGEYKNSLNVLYKDYDSWVKRTYVRQQNVKRIRTDMLIGCVIAYVIGSASVLMVSVFNSFSQGDGQLNINMDITSLWEYQLVSALFIIACIVFYTFTQLKYNGDWLVNERTDETIMKDYKLAFEADIKHIRVISIPIYIFFLIIAGICMFLKFNVAAICVIVVDIFLIFVPDINKKTAKKNVMLDIQNVFSDWLRDIALSMQNEPLRNAIKESYEECPVIMKESLREFINKIEEAPGSVQPYYDFLNEFDIKDISSTVRALYGMSELSEEEVDDAINDLIEKNYKLVEEYEMQKNEDTNSIMRFTEYVPVFFVAFKIGMDMLIMVQTLI